MFLTGSSGFYGKHILEYFKNSYEVRCFDRVKPIILKKDIVVHLAGKAHDLKNVSSFDEYYCRSSGLI